MYCVFIALNSFYTTMHVSCVDVLFLPEIRNTRQYNSIIICSVTKHWIGISGHVSTLRHKLYCHVV